MPVIKQKLENDTNPNPYNVSNAHPGFGVDPNIINEFGHTVYPKWVDHPTEKELVQIKQTVGQSNTVTHNVINKHPKRVLVHNEKEEAELLGKAKPKVETKAWDKGAN